MGRDTAPTTNAGNPARYGGTLLALHAVMQSTPAERSVGDSGTGSLPLQVCRIRLAGREWSLLHSDAVLSFTEEQHYLSEGRATTPYGLVLWPSAMALAHEIASRADAFRGTRVLELGAGTGLPGIIAASFGAHVVQTDRQELAMAMCRQNGERNGVRSIDYRLTDWLAWDDAAHYDWIIGADILYADTSHEALTRIFERNLAPGGRVLVADPFRKISLRLLETLEASGWTISMSKWSVGEDAEPRNIGVFELQPAAG
jgi:predicted nicotinamide N-methyase